MISRARRWRIALAALAGLATLLLSELALRLSVAERPPPLFVAAGAGRLRVNPARPEIVPVELPEHAAALRILWLGDSTVVGVPFDPQLSPPRWLALILAARGVPGEVTGLAGEGLDAGQVAAVLREALALQPDVVVVTTGHNEYLSAGATLQPRWWHAFALGRLVQGALQPHSLAPRAGQAPDHAGIAARFGSRLDQMVSLCAAAGVPLLLTEPVSNLLDMPPVLSGTPGADDADAAFAAGRAALQAGDVPAALAALRRARDLDRWPHRATSALVEAVRARAPHLVPAEALFAQASARGAPDRELFVDHCHPQPAGQRLLALAVADALEDLRVAPPSGRRGQALPLDEGLRTLGAGDALLVRARARVGRVFAGLALLRPQPGALAEEAALLLQDPALAEHVSAGELASSRTLLALARHDDDGARTALAATAASPEALARLRAVHDRYAWIAEAFRRAGLPRP